MATGFTAKNITTKELIYDSDVDGDVRTFMLAATDNAITLEREGYDDPEGALPTLPAGGGYLPIGFPPAGSRKKLYATSASGTAVLDGYVAMPGTN